MESELRAWLKRLYKEAPATGPEAKKIKFSHIKDDVQHYCQSMPISSSLLSRAISAEFSQKESKQLGKARHSYVLGIDRLAGEECSTSAAAAAVSDSSSQQIADLQHQIHVLQQKVHELEQQNESPVSGTFDTQMSQLLQADLSVHHGPNTVNNFEEFSVDAIFEELRRYAPDVYKLFCTIGQTSLHNEEDELSRLSQLRVMTSMTTLLKCRSVQVLGVQLLIAFMLIARSTSKQVRKIVFNTSNELTESKLLS